MPAVRAYQAHFQLPQVQRIGALVLHHHKHREDAILQQIGLLSECLRGQILRVVCLCPYDDLLDALVRVFTCR